MFKLLVSGSALLVLGCSGSDGSGARSDIGAVTASHVVEIVTPTVLQGLPMGQRDQLGRPTVTPCRTCHDAEDKSPLPDAASAPKGPHAGLTLVHGTLQCAACHDRTRRDQLHLADGTVIPLLEAMQLCGQCHGPQKRDYDHGAHGGMRGYWDLSRGPRERNHCVACHDPHAPAFGKFAPVSGPRDRFTAKESASHE